jgi:hypothetical protein
MPESLIHEVVTTGRSEILQQITKLIEAQMEAERAGTSFDPASAPKPWYETLDPATYAPDVATEMQLVLQRLADFIKEIKDESERITKETEAFRAEMDADVAAAGSNPSEILIATSKGMAKLFPLIAKGVELMARSMLLGAVRVGILKLLSGYPSESIQRQQTIKSWLSTFAQNSYAGGVQKFIDELPADLNPDTQVAMHRVAGADHATPEFLGKVATIALKYGMNATQLLAVMSFETGEKLDPAVRSRSGSGAVGLIQFTDVAAKQLGTTAEALSKMDALAKLDYVDKYFAQYAGKLRSDSLEDLYMAVLWPSAIGKSPDASLFQSPSLEYTQNSGLDANSDGKVTVSEATDKVREKIH